MLFSLLLRVCLAVAIFLLLDIPPTCLADHPFGIRPETAEGDDSSETCPSDAEIRETIGDKVRSTLRVSGLPRFQKREDFPCSGPEWTRVVYINMTDPTHTCPSAWQEYNNPKRVCGRLDISKNGYCNSFLVETNNVEYSKVCGRVVGYPNGTVDAFEHNIKNPNQTEGSLDGHYVDGISITYGYPPPRKHIWTLAAGALTEDYISGCPCQGPSSVATSPDYIGDNYFCESGSWDEPLWDGKGCQTDWCCSFNSPPWFSVTLTPPTREQLEVRICGSNRRKWEDALVEVMELYIQ